MKRHLEPKIADPLRVATERQVLSLFESALSRWHGIRLRMESVLIRQALATADFSEDEWLLFQSDTRNLRRCFRGFAGRNRKSRRRKRADTHCAKECLPVTVKGDSALRWAFGRSLSPAFLHQALLHDLFIQTYGPPACSFPIDILYVDQYYSYREPIGGMD